MMKKQIVWITIISILMILIPIIIFGLNFYSREIPLEIAKWGAFGDYFGGILNTIISILSLIILGYISYLISKTSTTENKNLFYLQKKVEAYEEFAKLLPNLNIIPRRMTQLIKEINNSETDTVSINFLSEKFELLSLEINLYYKYHFFIVGFNARYGHLFTYDFQSEKYKELLISSKKFGEVLDLCNSSSIDVSNVKENLQSSFDNHINKLVDFVNDLKAELK